MNGPGPIQLIHELPTIAQTSDVRLQAKEHILQAGKALRKRFTQDKQTLHAALRPPKHPRRCAAAAPRASEKSTISL